MCTAQVNRARETGCAYGKQQTVSCMTSDKTLALPEYTFVLEGCEQLVVRQLSNTVDHEQLHLILGLA